jgi:cell division protein FtsW (lipid II flippase)
MKKRLTQTEEFEILKLVLDKFLWLGVGVMGLGLWRILNSTIREGVYFLIIGIVVLLVFLVILIREYEYLK